MIPATFTLLVAAASTNALPIFLSGLFAPRAVSPAATVVKRDNLNSTQFAQGTNFFFSTLLLEAECTPGQVACIDGKTATCSAEANWEVTPCSGNTTCFAIPASSDPTDDSVVVKCLTQEDAATAFGTTNFSEDFQITAAPFNSLIPDPSSSDSNTDVPSATDSFTDVPSATDSSTDVPTSTDASIPDPTCTEDPEATETETITVIAIPIGGDNSTDYSFSTVFPDPTDTEVDSDTATATETATDPVIPTATQVDSPTTTDCAGVTYQPTSLTTCDDVATLYGITSDDVSSNNQFVDCNNIWAYTVLCLPEGATPSDNGSSTDAPTPTADGSSDPAPTDSSASSTDDAAPTTLVVPPANVAPAPEVSIVDTHVIPASSSIVPPANLKMRKVRRS